MSPVKRSIEEPTVSKLVASIQYPYEPLSDAYAYIDPYPNISDIEQTRRDSVGNLLGVFANEDDLLKGLCEKLNSVWIRPKNRGMMLDCSGPPRIPCPECLKTKYRCKDFASCWAEAFRTILKDLEDLGKDCETNPFGDGCAGLVFESLKFQKMLTAPPCSKSSTPKRCYMEQLIRKAQTSPTDAIKQLIELLTILSGSHRGLVALIEFLKSLLGPPEIDQKLLIEILKKLRDAWGEPVPPINPVPPTNSLPNAPPPAGLGLPPWPSRNSS